MNQPTDARILTHFANLEDPRDKRGKDHYLIDIIAIAICAVICKAESWVDIELYGQSKQEWFRTFLSLNNGIPSHDTFARVFARLDPEQMQQCFRSLDHGDKRVERWRSRGDRWQKGASLL